jgi:hypothetical protein
MSDRLEELRRQRSLQREHLAWLDREIAALEGVGQPPLSPVPPQAAVHFPAELGNADAILEEYRRPAGSIERRTKLGCFLYVALALAMLGLAVTALYFFERAKRGH